MQHFMQCPCASFKKLVPGPTDAVKEQLRMLAQVAQCATDDADFACARLEPKGKVRDGSFVIHCA